MKDSDDPTLPIGLAKGSGVTRRETLQGSAAVVAAPVLMRPGKGEGPAEERSPIGAAVYQGFALKLVINGESVEHSIDIRTSLLDFLRERVGLTGAKKGCDHGQCGACTVHLDGSRVLSCLTLAAQAQGRKVLTIEGLAQGKRLHPMQQTFIDHDALQCGYCTPGQIMSAIACVEEGNATSPERIREYMSGNICRCGAYPGIVAAIQDAAHTMRQV